MSKLFTYFFQKKKGLVTVRDKKRNKYEANKVLEC